MTRENVEIDRQVIVLETVPSRQLAPFVFESKRCRRVGSSSAVMSQEEYARLSLDRSHSRYRWENQHAVGVRVEDLDREETLERAIHRHRAVAGPSPQQDGQMKYLSAHRAEERRSTTSCNP